LQEQGNKAVVAIPIYRQRPSKTEEIAYRQALLILGNHPIALVAPDGLDVSFYQSLHSNLIVERFTTFYFQGISGYSQLLLSPKFYRRFIKYEFILIYQLDAFVFRDELLEWCNEGFDYIGAPWFQNFHNFSEGAGFLGVGNGGFSLRRIRSCLRALHKLSWIMTPHEIWNNYLSHNMMKRIIYIPDLLTNFTVRNNTFHMFNNFSGNEDLFWGLHVTKNFKWFNSATIDASIRFSFECNPRILFQQNNSRLPFGCHAWMRYDYEFWKPHIENIGHHL